MIAKPVKVSKGFLKKRCDILASKYYRALTPYCELAGLDGISCSGPLAWAHIVTRSVLHMRYEPYNHLILCNEGHHAFYTGHPLAWTEVLEKHFPERLQLAQLNLNKVIKVDYALWITKFSQTPEPLPVPQN